MAIANPPKFSQTQDLHILRSDPGIVLGDLLGVSWPIGPDSSDSGTLTDYLKLNRNDFAIEFRPVRRFAESPDKKRFVEFGIDIDKSSGAMVLTPGPVPEPWPHNFIVEAVVTQNPGGPANVPPAALRLHVHERVEKIWLTPGRLTIWRRTANDAERTDYRFTVRAQFDDDTVGDITASGRFAVPANDADWFYSGELIRIPSGVTSTSSIRTVTIMTTAAWNGRSAQGEIKVLDPWDVAQDAPQAELIQADARVLNGTIKPEAVPNVLFLPAGLTAADWNAFRTLTDSLVHELASKSRFNPYRYLAPSMNFWRLPLFTSEPGVSVRCEVYPFTRDGVLYAAPVPPPVKPRATGNWTLSNLIYVAGLPMPGDRKGVVSVAGLRQRWAQTFPEELSDRVPVGRSVPEQVIEAWQRCAERTFIDEVDNFPAIAIGEPPSISFDPFSRIEFHPLRGGSPLPNENPDRVALFRRVTAVPRNGLTLVVASSGGSSHAIGNLWAEDRPDRAFDNRRFITAIGNMPVGHIEFGGSQYAPPDGPIYMRPTVRAPDFGAHVPGLHVTREANRNALKLTLPPLSSIEFSPETWDTFAHELTHAFNLGDEYGSAGVYPFDETFLGEKPNLQTPASVLDADQKVLINKLKWNWPRIHKAAVLTGKVQPTGSNTFEVSVEPKHGIQFTAGDQVLLRLRVPRVAVAPAFQVIMSGECKVDSVSADGRIVSISRTAGTLDLSLFGAGCILFLPLRAPPTLQPFRPYLTLVSPLAERIMAATESTMSGKLCNPDDPRNSQRVQAPRLPSASGDFGPINARPRLVGVYFGGAGEYACGIVHPAGSCKMRSSFDSYSRLCQVCQYVLVEQIDPAQHGKIDRDYARDYTL